MRLLAALSLVAPMLLVGWLGLPIRAEATVCASYPYLIVPNRCNQDGFCGYYDFNSLTIDDGIGDTNDPAPGFGIDTEPILFSDDVMVGAADLFAIGGAEMEAGRSVVRAKGEGDVAAPCCSPPASASVDARALSVMRVTDLVFSGPSADVETSLRLVFDGSLEQFALATEEATASSRTSAAIGGAICSGTEFMDFLGTRSVMLRDPGGPGGVEFIVIGSFGALEDVPFDAETEIVIGPFTVPTGAPLNFELWMETTVAISTGGGDADGIADLALHAGAPGGGLVFELPAGYRADSAQAGIVDSVSAPEPGASLAILAAAFFLAGFRASRVGSR